MSGTAVSNRRISWTKNTNYASVASPRPPMEVGSHAHAPNKSVEQQLETSKQRINEMHRKSLVMLAGQRKLLEKSMLAYTEKVKEINDRRTSELFREIQSRNGASSRSLPDIHINHGAHDEVQEPSKVKKRHKVNFTENNDPFSDKQSLSLTEGDRASVKEHAQDFSKLRSLLRRASSADLIDTIKIRQVIDEERPVQRFVSTQSLLDTADYLEQYRQKVRAEFKPKKVQLKSIENRLESHSACKRDNYDSANNSGFESNDEFSESDTKFRERVLSNASSSKTVRARKTLPGIKRKASKAKPKINRKGRKLLKKLNAEDNYTIENLQKPVVMTTIVKSSDRISS